MNPTHDEIRHAERERIARFLRERAKAMEAYPQADLALQMAASAVEANVMPLRGES